ncbi:MAG: hypothetical protein D6819_09865, partial [Gammaproteobacteria bacterium]
KAYLKYMIALAAFKQGDAEDAGKSLHSALKEIDDHPKLQTIMRKAWQDKAPLPLDFYQAVVEENHGKKPCA